MQAAEFWTGQLQQRLAARFAPQPPPPPALAAAQRLASLFDRASLADHTKLLDSRGTDVRRGSSLLITTAENGGMLVQGEH